LELDATKLDSALQNKFDNVVTLLTANKENQSSFSVLPAGTAGEAVKKLTAMLDTSAALTTQSTNLSTKIASYQKELAAPRRSNDRHAGQVQQTICRHGIDGGPIEEPTNQLEEHL
jgi:flagellar capping protein FliD